MDNTLPQKAILCIPGLGGHPTAFGGYDKLIPGYKFIFIELVDWQRAQKEIREIAKKEKDLIILCSCYGLQLALRLIEEMPNAASRLVLIEPFFAEFNIFLSFLSGPARILTRGLFFLSKFLDGIGIKREKFPYKDKVDYIYLSKYPIYFQPIFDMRWQHLTPYLEKIEDILTYRLPERVETKTLFIFSPRGFVRSGKIKGKLRRIFINADIAHTHGKGHNIITASREEVAMIIKRWLEN